MSSSGALNSSPRRPGCPSRGSRAPQVGVDVAGQHVLGLDQAQGLDIAGIGGAGTLGGRQLGAHVAREIDIRRLPDLGVGVLVDEVAQLGDDLADWGLVERGDEGQVHHAALVEGDQQPFLGALHGRPWRVAPDHVVVQDGRLLGQARALVIVLQGHDQHGVRIVAERHEVGHAPDRGAVRGGREGRLVDGAIGRRRSGHRRGSAPGGPPGAAPRASPRSGTAGHGGRGRGGR